MNDADFAAGSFLAGMGVFVIVCIVAAIAIAIIPFWFITKRLGWDPLWSLLMILPMGALIWSYYVAFAKWPIDNRPGGPPAQGV